MWKDRVDSSGSQHPGLRAPGVLVGWKQVLPATNVEEEADRHAPP